MFFKRKTERDAKCFFNICKIRWLKLYPCIVKIMTIQLDCKTVIRRKRISMTSLIDIVFILLIFFILETHFVQLGEIDFNLPVDESLSEPLLKQRGPSNTLKIEVFSADKLWIAGEVFTVSTLDRYIKESGFTETTPIVLASQPYVELQVLVAVMDTLRDNSLQKIQFSAVAQ